jgi:hypothetical protein
LDKLNTKCTRSHGAIEIIGNYALSIGGSNMGCVDISNPHKLTLLCSIKTGATQNSVHSDKYHKVNHSSICIKDENTAFV